MIYTRQEHRQFLEEELRAQTEAFQQKLDTSATFLLMEREELFVAQFLKFENGEMILKFSNKRGLPRKGEYLYCFTVPKELRDYRNWDNKTYGDLIKEKGNFTEAVCIWQSTSKDKDGKLEKDFCLAGFRGVELDFAVNISEAIGMILLLGPNKPPYEYIANLQKVVQNNHSETVNQILDQDFQNINWQPALLDNKNNIPDFIVSQLSLGDTLILQGPPGTGKTYLIAQICEKLCKQGKSVLVTALTNSALMEVAEKPALRDLLKEHFIFKTKISTDEAKEIPDLRQTKEVNPQPGQLILSTFYITSGEAAQAIEGKQFDYVIVDEASQALLAMFGAAKILGKKNIWIGDIKQLPPVVSINEDKIRKKNYGALVDGLKALSEMATIPNYQLTETYRLPERAANYTGIFYSNNLLSKAKKDVCLSFSEMNPDCSKYFHLQGGSTLIKVEMEVGNKRPTNALNIAVELLVSLLNINEKLHLSVLTYYVETTKALQKAIYQTIGNHKNLLVETVSRVQGLTTDITIFVIPNSGYNHSLEKRLFNVATSRAKRHTLIIADKNVITSYSFINKEVKTYLQKLDDEFSFYVSPQLKMLKSRNKEDTSKKQEVKQIEVEETTKNDKKENSAGLKIIGQIDLSQFEKAKKEIKKDKQNIYIIDTNVFVDYPDVISKIDKTYQIVLSAKVIDELDYLKISLSEGQKKNVQMALKLINDNLGKRDIKMDTADLSLLPNDFNKKSPDNLILSVALKYKQENPILFTSDNSLQIKAKGLNITTITLKDFLKQNLPSNLYYKWLNNKK
ncbi:MAG: AAA family ATPase [Dysgonamonadaceae bacterium]|jgi:rRNA-processing protein FCF1|nr:AAA family ATPase [Dysgonamonadaceae bacterium]